MENDNQPRSKAMRAAQAPACSMWAPILRPEYDSKQVATPGSALLDATPGRIAEHGSDSATPEATM